MNSIKYSEKVTVILVNYNGRKFLDNCIGSLKKQTYSNMSVLIVDNCSEDDSVKFLKENYPEIEVIACNKNYGFAKANNIGIKYAIGQGTDYVMLLNVDTAIDSSLIEKLIREADSNVVTVPKIYSDKRYMKIWYAGGGIDYVNGDSYHTMKGGDGIVQEVSFACGCCMLIHKNIIQKCGMLDENYYLYYEDTDWSVRFGKENIKIKYVPEAKMWHKIGGSGGKMGGLYKTYYLTRNQLYFIKKHQDCIHSNTFMKTWQIFKDNFFHEPDREKRKYIWFGIRDFYKGKTGRL
ncbi:glycosyltransferase family 2 protein [Acetatifactor aquisgranensis]|uniref:glycosyltransferase family 2 protein n=1 Tax=Acetatifactor aquisgranensis TaxID=2941233 RepID=UPI0020419A8A|nr:glycosyltransferase family 2 protein [Acetatifactor aquisgranensis]